MTTARAAQTKKRPGRGAAETAALAPGGERPADPRVPPAAPSALTRPADIEGEAAVIWDALAPVLEADGRLVPGDEYGFADLCRVRALVKQAHSELGRITDGGEGTGEKTHATVEFKNLSQLQAMAQRLENRFGLTPMARKQLGIKPKRRTSSVNDALGA